MKCDYCAKEMTAPETTSCDGLVTFPDGKEMTAVPYHDDDPAARCHDCGIAVGGTHHPGCDMERCPRCEGQLISCGCLDASEYE